MIDGCYKGRFAITASLFPLLCSSAVTAEAAATKSPVNGIYSFYIVAELLAPMPQSKTVLSLMPRPEKGPVYLDHLSPTTKNMFHLYLNGSYLFK